MNVYLNKVCVRRLYTFSDSQTIKLVDEIEKVMSKQNYELYERDEPNLNGFERELYQAVSADEPWSLVERFSELERVSGSNDEIKAAEYITGRLDELGVPHDRYDPEIWLSIPQDASIQSTAPVKRSFGDDTGPPSIKTVAFSKSGSVTGDVVHVEPPEMGGGRLALNATFDNLDEDIDGKVVLVEANYLSREMIMDIEDRGAEAIIGIHLHEEEPHEGIATPVWGGVPHPDRQDRVPNIVITNVSKSVGDELRDLATEGLEVEVTAQAPRKWSECPVIVSRIPGEADSEDDDFVLLHGHYDSWWYGIADNATGDAGLLELARVFNEHRDQLKRDLWVAWWPAHSTGRYGGSTWFATEYALKLDERCIAQVNMDSPGATDATEFRDMVGWMSAGNSLCKSAINDVCGKESEENRLHRAGDASFNNIGVTGLFMLSSNIPKEVRDERGYHPVGGCGGNSNAWHLSTDTLDKADSDVLVRDIRVYATLVSRLLRENVIPLDFQYTVDRHQEIIENYQEAAGEHFDLSPIKNDLTALDGALSSFYEDANSGRISIRKANETLKQVERHLTRVNYVSEGKFEQDPAKSRPPYPQLEPATDLPDMSGDEYKFCRVHLKRAQNDVRHELRSALEALK